MAKYNIIEMQTGDNGITAFLTDQNDNRNTADSIYYQKLAAAAISTVPIHTVLLVQDDGATLKSAYYDHREQTE